VWAGLTVVEKTVPTGSGKHSEALVTVLWACMGWVGGMARALHSRQAGSNDEQHRSDKRSSQPHRGYTAGIVFLQTPTVCCVACDWRELNRRSIGKTRPCSLQQLCPGMLRMKSVLLLQTSRLLFCTTRQAVAPWIDTNTQSCLFKQLSACRM